MNQIEWPIEWNRKKIGQISQIKGGKRMPKDSEFAEYRTIFPYLRVIDFRDGTVDTSNLLYVLPKDEAQIRRYKISSDDVYITIAGTIGLVGSIPDKLDNSLLTENAAKITNFDNTIINKYFLAYFMNCSWLGPRILLFLSS